MVILRLPFERSVKCVYFGNNMVKFEDIRHHLISNFSINDFVLYYNGKQLYKSQVVPEDATIHVTFSLPGGKGGFGSMLRAIGAQIEKTTNREACRDLSGRRLRDINEEQRLKKWIAKEAEREAEKVRRRKQRIERLKSQPKHNFVDFEYEKEISQLPERIDEALSEGIQKASKRPTEIGACSSQPSKKKCLWMDDLSESSDSDSQEASSSSENGSSRDNIQTSKSEESDCSENSNLSEMKPLDAEEHKLGNNSSSTLEKEQTSVKNIAIEEHPSTSCSTEEQCSSFTTDEQKETMLDKNTNTIFKSSVDGASTTIKEENSVKTSEVLVDSKDISTSAANNVPNENVDLLSFQSASELECLGLDRLKAALMARGLKCGGTLSDRVQRLWRIRGLQPSEYPSNLLAKKK
ncbi:replication stress response regulator SDE2 [Trichonephila clavipes]|nr:replication stress response regulator SDE2 [Trichonephila clavipes]